MQRDKALLCFDGSTTLLSRNLALLQRICDDVLVSVRDQAQAERYKKSTAPAETSYLLDSEVQGPAAALMAAYQHDATAMWLVLAVDFPLVSSDTLQRLLPMPSSSMAVCYENSSNILEPLMAVWAPEALFRLERQIEELGDASPQSALRSAMQDSQSNVCLLRPQKEHELLNTNTAADWELAKKLPTAPHKVDVHELTDAMHRWAAAFPSLAVETISCTESIGRVAAVDVRAAHDLPPFRNSAMDGIVIRTCDLSQPSMRVTGVLAAGEPPRAEHVPPGCCWEINTGAALPLDLTFDAVVIAENLIYGDKGKVTFGGDVRPGQHIRQAGEDIQIGDILVQKGSAITPAAIAALISATSSGIEVLHRLRVGILPTGSELVEPGMCCSPGKIRDSNTPMLKAFIEKAGHDCVAMRPVKDDLTSLMDAFASLPVDVHALVITGGASKGHFDFVPELLLQQGARFFFRGVPLRPGRPCHIASVRNLPVFALPGNPLAALACCRFLVLPFLRARAMGQRERALGVGRLCRPISRHPTDCLVRLGRRDFDGLVQVLDGQRAGQMGAMSRANCWITIAPGASTTQATEVWPLYEMD